MSGLFLVAHVQKCKTSRWWVLREYKHNRAHYPDDLEVGYQCLHLCRVVYRLLKVYFQLRQRMDGGWGNSACVRTVWCRAKRTRLLRKSRASSYLSHSEHPLAQNLPCTTEGDTTPVRCSSAPCLCLKWIHSSSPWCESETAAGCDYKNGGRWEFRRFTHEIFITLFYQCNVLKQLW